MTKRLFMLLLLACTFWLQAQAVLKEKDLDETLSVLRQELVKRYAEVTGQMTERRQQNRAIQTELMEMMKRSNQNSLMLYSQNINYVFDMTYACHEATEQYQQFLRMQLPFRDFLESHDAEIAKFDSLIVSLRQMPAVLLSQRARVDRSVCLTLAINIRSSLEEHRSQTVDYMRYYEMSERRLSHLNDYAQERYTEIQRSIFMNGSDNYLTVMKNLPEKWEDMHNVMRDKYTASDTSQWSSTIIFGLFFVIFFYVIIATALNQLVIRVFVPRRLRTDEFMKKRTCIIMATTTITFALIMAIGQGWGQNFVIMASDLLIEYAWLLGVILISLLLRVSGDQIKSSFHLYAPLMVISFLVIAFRIVLIPKELINLVFPPVLALATLWQWSVMARHNRNVPRQDMLYSYLSLMVFIGAMACSWMGYTLLAVQILIWWTMQLACVLTITCMSSWMNLYSKRKNMDERPITKSWHYNFIYHVVTPILGVLSLMISVYWAADVFNLSDLCWRLFNMHFVDMQNLQLSIVKLTMVVCLWFIFRYLATTLLAFMRLHFENNDLSTADSRMVMSRNIVQVLVWGVWLMLSLGILHISLAWLLAISGGLSTGIGFASKNIIENIFYGASLMTGRLKVGDLVEMDGIVGKVQQISYTSTVVESLAGEIITFQNSQLFDKNYKNLTRNRGYVAVPVMFGVAYGTSLQRVQQLVDNAVNALESPWVDPLKEAHAIVVNMNDSSVDFKIIVWADVVKRAIVTSQVLTCIYDTLNENGIEIPFPQRDIHIIAPVAQEE